MSGVDVDREREAWTADPTGYTTPTAAARTWLPQAGRGHFARGVWPPGDIPPRVWRVVRLWLRCDRWGVLPGPGTVGDQDAWTMDAFDLLDGTLSAIKRARDEEARFKARAAKG